MIDLVEKLREKYPRVFPIYIGNREMVSLLNEAYSAVLLVANEYMKRTEKVLISEANREQFQNYFQYLTTGRKVLGSTVRVAQFAIEYYRNEIVLKPIQDSQESRVHCD